MAHNGRLFKAHNVKTIDNDENAMRNGKKIKHTFEKKIVANDFFPPWNVGTT
jgi:hypothetical protein